MHALLIDGLNLIRRVHAGVPGEDETQHADAVLNACVASLRRALRRHQPSHALCALDGEGPSWRRDLFSDYKKLRKPMPEDLRLLLPRVIERFAKLGVASIEITAFEADDVIASVADRLAKVGSAVTILSTDKSFCQLLGPNLWVLVHQFADRQDTPAGCFYL